MNIVTNYYSIWSKPRNIDISSTSSDVMITRQTRETKPLSKLWLFSSNLGVTRALTIGSGTII